MTRQLALVGHLGRMVIRRRLWFLIPLVTLLLIGLFLLIAVESPALLPSFYMFF